MKYVIVVLFALFTIFSIQLSAESTVSAVDRLKSIHLQVDYNETMFEDVLNDLEHRTGISFLTDEDEYSEGIVENTRISLNHKHLSAYDAVYEIAQQAKMYFVIQYGVVWFIYDNQVLETENVIKMYNIDDLLPVVHDFDGVVISLKGNATGPSSTQNTELHESDDEFEGYEELDVMVIENVVPASWDENPEAEIVKVARRLIVRQTPAVHRKIEIYLEELRKAR